MDTILIRTEATVPALDFLHPGQCDGQPLCGPYLRLRWDGARDVTRVGETIAYSRLRRDLDDFGQSRLLVLVLQQQLV